MYWQRFFDIGCIPEWKGPSVKIQLLDIFKDHHIVAQSGPTTVGYDEWPLSNVLWIKSYWPWYKYKPELSEHFRMYRSQLNFKMFCPTSALGISWHPLSHPNLLVRGVYQFYLYFRVFIILHHLGTASFATQRWFYSKVKNSYIKSVKYSICKCEWNMDEKGLDLYGSIFCFWW